MKRITALFLCLLLCLMLFVGCGSKSSGAYAMDEAPMEIEEAWNGEYDYDGSDYSSVSDATSAGGSSKSESSAGQDANASQRKVIRNASLEMHSEDVQTCRKSLVDYAVSLGGYEFTQYMSSDGTKTSIDMEIKLPPEKLDAFFEVRGRGRLCR